MVTNERTIASVKVAGMKEEGILREYYCQNGKYIDGWKYSLLKSEYFSMESQNSENNFVSELEIIELIQSVLTQEVVILESSIDNTSTWDSLSHMQIMIEIYQRYNIQFSPSQMANAISVSRISNLLNNYGK